MSRLFRIKYMRFMAVLMAVAVFVGSVDTSILYVQAAQEDESNVEGSDDADGADRDSNTDDEAEQEETSYEDDVAAVADESGKTQVTISGIKISDKTYDGKPITYDDSEVKIEMSENNDDVTDIPKEELQYSYSGKTANGVAYPSDGDTSKAPTDAGTYKLAVTLSYEDYEGSWEQPFQITKRQVTISGVDIFSKRYDGEPITYTNNVEITIEGSPELDEDSGVKDALKKELQYSFSGIKSKGDQYPGEDETDETEPKDAGTYSFAVTLVDNNYEGSWEKSFQIQQRKVTIRPRDVMLTMGDEIPALEEYGYEVTLDDDDDNPFYDEGGFTTYPTITCAIESTAFPATYPITASEADAGNNYEFIYEEGVLTVSEPEPEKADLIRIIPPNPVTDVANGTPLAEIALPETVQIVITDIDRQSGGLGEVTTTAEVSWNRNPINGTTYVPAITTAQKFELGGTVILPSNVKLPDDAEEKELTLDVTITVNVREAMESTQAVTAPTASIPTGSYVPYGTRVELSCETEGAVIYYTLDSSTPTTASMRYSAPIAITGFRVIQAYAHKDGWPDSPIVKFTYFLDGTTGGGTGGNTGNGDEDSDSEPEVPEEDIPAGGVKDNFWATDIKYGDGKDGFDYTGNAIKPEVRVYGYKTLLEEKKDYTITYKNNVNAADASAQNAPAVIITGKGNYEGKITKTFTIKPKDISDPDVDVEDVTVAYTGKAQKPSPTVIWNGRKLTNGRDYTIPDVSYTDATADDTPRQITVTGCGNYTGEKTFNFIITNGVPASKLTVTKIPDQTYTGEEIKPKVTVKYQGTEMLENVNYSIEGYQNNVEVGTATVIIKGMDRFVGTKKVTFKIKAVASLSKAKVNVQFDSAPTYTGQEIYADRVTVTLNLKENGQSVTRTLDGDTDYTLSYQNNIKKGTATVTVTGKGAYSGKTKKTFKIAAHNIGADGVKVTLNNSNSYPYEKGGSKPQPKVSFGNTTLKLGTDYTLSYKQSNAAGKTATVTVKGKGNFTGSIAKTYLITSRDISEMTVRAADKTYKNKKNIYKTTVRLIDTNGKALKAGTDYNKNIVYTYADDTFKEAGSPVLKDDIIPAGTSIKVTITAKGTNYTGEVSGTYRIVGASISKAKVTIPAQTYTGKAITLSEDQIQVKVNGEIIPVTDYEIYSERYSNNIKKGTAKVTIHGLNNYGGTKTVSFKIKAKGPSN